jgi:hypothetical protein
MPGCFGVIEENGLCHSCVMAANRNSDPISEGVNLKPTSKEESKVLKKSKVLIQPNAFSIFLSKSAFFSLRLK